MCTSLHVRRNSQNTLLATILSVSLLAFVKLCKKRLESLLNKQQDQGTFNVKKIVSHYNINYAITSLRIFLRVKLQV